MESVYGFGWPSWWQVSAQDTPLSVTQQMGLNAWEGALGDCDLCWVVRHPTPDTTQAVLERCTVTAGHTAPPSRPPGLAVRMPRG